MRRRGRGYNVPGPGGIRPRRAQQLLNELKRGSAEVVRLADDAAPAVVAAYTVADADGRQLNAAGLCDVVNDAVQG
jgi:hypothetical protein